MFPNYSYLLYYCPYTDPNEYDLLGDESQSNITEHVTAIFSMDGRLILVCNTLHVPSLREPLYSTLRHCTQSGCAYHNDNTVGNLLLFPTTVINVEYSTDNIVNFRPIDCTLSNRKLDYVKPSPDSARLAKHPLSLMIVNTLVSTQPPYKHPTPAPLAISPKVDFVYPSDIDKLYLIDMPDICPCKTASPSDTQRTFEPLKLHRIFGCCQFRNPKYITSAEDDATLIDAGELHATLNACATIPKVNEGISKLRHDHFLETFYMDIVYGDCTSMGGYHYRILLGNTATQYCWFHSLKSTTSNDIVNDLSKFRVDSGTLPCYYHSEFDCKLIRGKFLQWINDKNSKIIAAPAKR